MTVSCVLSGFLSTTPTVAENSVVDMPTPYSTQWDLVRLPKKQLPILQTEQGFDDTNDVSVRTNKSIDTNDACADDSNNETDLPEDPDDPMDGADDLDDETPPETLDPPEEKNHQFWPHSRVYHTSFGEKIPNTIKDFCHMQDIQVVLDPKVEALPDKINRMFRNMYPVDVWDQLTKTYGLLWFFDGSVLYVYLGTDISTNVFNIHPEQTDSLLHLVEDLGFHSSKLSIKVVKDAGLVVATGAPKFIELLQAISTGMRMGKTVLPEDITIRLFRLKHTWVDDKAIGSLTIPGMVSMLNELLGSGGSGKEVDSSSSVDARLSHRSEALKGVLRQKEEEKEKKEEPGPEGAEKKESLPSGGIIAADRRQNAVIVKDVKTNMHLYEELITTLDVPLEVIEIQVAIVDIDNSAGLTFGADKIEFGRLNGKHFIQINPVGKGPKSPNEDSWTINTQLKGIVNGHNFLSAVRYLEERSVGRLLARPSVITMDNMEATMSRSDTVYESVSGEKTNDLFPITAGTTVTVTPHIIRTDGELTQIQLILNIKDGTVIPKSGTDKSNTKDSTIVTQAVVTEGQSVLVGGYFRENQSIHDSGVPFLKNIPLLGAMFRAKGRNKTISERLFMITPTILHLSANDSEANKIYFKPTKNGESILEEPKLEDVHVKKTP